jgi:hypothetical protein
LVRCAMELVSTCESALARNIMHHLYLPAMAADILKTSAFCHVGLHTALKEGFHEEYLSLH